MERMLAVCLGIALGAGPAGAVVTAPTLHTFVNSEGCKPYGELIDGGDFASLHGFTGYFVGADGGHPEAPLVDGGDGSFYGTTSDGGTSNVGTIYRIDANGDYALLHSFRGGLDPFDGATPRAGLARGDDGKLYGTTSANGPPGSTGTVFRFTPGGSGVETIHAFTTVEGSGANSTLVKGADGWFYGTTDSGGTATRAPSSGSRRVATSRPSTPSRTGRATESVRSASRRAATGTSTAPPLPAAARTPSAPSSASAGTAPSARCTPSGLRTRVATPRLDGVPVPEPEGAGGAAAALAFAAAHRRRRAARR